jgi:PGF-CTERM protein
VTFDRTEETSTQPVLQLAGPTSVEVSKNDMRQPLGTVDVTESTESEFVVENPEQYTPNYEIIEANPDAGFYYPYLLYRPNVSETFERPLYVEPLNSRSAANREELVSQIVNRYNGSLFAGARQNEYPGIIPGFPRTPDDGPDTIQSLALPSYRSELLFENYKLEDIATEEFPADTLTRIDEQLLAMIEDAKSRLTSESYSVADEIHMSGFSSSANFSSRFAFLYPNKVRTLTIGGHPLVPLPKDSHEDISLPYPLGTADYEEFTGREFDTEAWADINQYIYLGEEDQPLPDTDSVGYYNTIRYQDKAETVFGINRVTERLPFVRSQYTEVTDNAAFETFEGIGHSIDERMEDAIVDFHQQNSPTPNPDTTPEENESETNESTPGFGIGSGVTALGALGYMLRRRLTDASE